MIARTAAAGLTAWLGLFLLGAPAPVEAQTTSADPDWEAPRTEHGHPNLQGNWSNSTVTPLQRAPGQDRVLTPEQVMEVEGTAERYLLESFDPVDPDREAPPQGGDFSGDPTLIAAAGGTGGYEYFFLDRGERVAIVDGEPRSSLITIPENGRMPSITPEAQEMRRQQAAALAHFESRDHPELLSLGDRCITSFGANAGPPMLPNYFYNNNYTITQTADYVVILTEMVHDARIIRLTDGPPLPDGIDPWFGDSRGWWEGETLVVVTENIRPAPQYQFQPSANMKVTERFTRIEDETILYEFLVEDPTTWTEPWGGEIPMHALDGLVFEYACHEGNYAMENILRGARFEERQAAEAADDQGP